MTTDSSSSAGIPIGSSVSSVHVQHHDLVVSCWPIRDSMASRIVLAAVVVSTAIVAWWTQQLVVPIVMGLLLFCCLMRLWLPSRFEIGPIGITRVFLGRRKHLPWYLTDRIEHCPDGVRVYPRTGGAGLSAFHAIHIYDRESAEQLHELTGKYHSPAS